MLPVEYSDLTIGVEIEFTRLTRKEAADVIAKFFSTTSGLVQKYYDGYEIRDSINRIWRIKRDASIWPQRLETGVLMVGTDDYKCELVSPILQYTDIPLLQELICCLVTNGAGTNESTGLHIHIGAERFTPNSLRVLCNILYAKQLLLNKSVQITQFRKWYCKNLPENLITLLNKRKPKTFEQFADIWYSGTDSGLNSRSARYHITRYRILNLHPLLGGRQNTIEFRLFNGSLDHEAIKSYIQLSLLITAQALNQKKATSRISTQESGNDKYALRVWLLKLGGIGDEFKTMRHYLIGHLNGNAAWRTPPKASEDVSETAVELEEHRLLELEENPITY
ncbi:amidoligase family protein [Paenibacillus sp. 19GGS1-52]|uniref:amidoligase family protein n=1 Tax=Paenibacillus sp. 19GGS1-52 TaxID=2758563 RepID=UPI001EFAA51D|nr:amidoligase family protein [Paenibacillus sp. 19GGS1-52]ULO06275.1 amidoligase family protein [Paenibacillus sp. 19GGS1-52]